MKKIFGLLMATCLIVASLSACGKQTTNPTKGTVDTKPTETTEATTTSTETPTDKTDEADKESICTTIEKEFSTLALAEGATAESIIAGLSELEMLNELALMNMAVEAGNLAGFTEEIDGFKEGHVLAPMIGSIPFIVYVFEVEENPADFAAKIKGVSDMRWNICTAAEETACMVSDNFVLLAMAPMSWDDEGCEEIEEPIDLPDENFTEEADSDAPEATDAEEIDVTDADVSEVDAADVADESKDTNK